ncbi:MAG: arylsulfatase [Leptospiraceae bacterium]|nr:arylsulfatase [Leptospiraceae bacterium]
MKFLILLTALILYTPLFAQNRPNVVVVLLDDIGFMDFGSYGSNTSTPTINKMSKSGAMFSRYYTSPSCGPSRAMLLTGQDNHTVGMGALVETITPEMSELPGYSMVWKDQQQTMASLLKAAGYQTFVTGKWGIGGVGQNLPDRFGFDRSYVMDATGGNNYNDGSYLVSKAHVKWFEDGKPTKLPDDYYSSRSLVDKMIKYIDESDQQKPFFAFLSMQAVHIPVQVEKKWIDKYNGVFDRGWDVMREERLKKAIELGLVPEGTKLSPRPAHHRVWANLSAEEQKYWARVMQVNAGMMEAADFHTGRLLDHLEKIGKLKNTIVIVTSDNGAESAVIAGIPGPAGAVTELWMKYEGYNVDYEHLGEAISMNAIGPEWASVSSAPFSFYKFNGSEGGLRVPLVVSGPGINSKGILDGRAHVTDLAPTILDAVQVAYKKDQFTGRSLMPILEGKTKNVYSNEDVVGFEVQGTGAIYRGDWKITRIPPPLGDGNWHLYNVALDPGETNDLASKNPVLFQELINEYQRYATSVGIFETPVNESAKKNLIKNQLFAAAKRFWPVITVLIGVIGILIFLSIQYIRRMKK